MVGHNNRQPESIIQSFLTYVVTQQDSSDKHNDCSVQNIDELVDLLKISVGSLLSGRNLVLAFYF